MRALFSLRTLVGISPLLALIFIGVLANARITAPSAGQRDAFCAGPRSSEACIDQSGNVLATTDNTSTLGTSALRWANIYGVSLTVSGSQTGTSLVLTSGVTAASGTFTNGVTASSFTATGTPGFGGDSTNLTGTAASLTAGHVTTNANLTGGVTSVGNAATVVTNANLTGDVTSVGNATTAAATQANITTLSAANGVTVTSSVTVKSSMTIVDSAASDTYVLIVATGTIASQQIITISTTGAATIGAGALGFFHVPTRQIFTSGSSVYYSLYGSRYVSC